MKKLVFALLAVMLVVGCAVAFAAETTCTADHAALGTGDLRAAIDAGTCKWGTKVSDATCVEPEVWNVLCNCGVKVGTAKWGKTLPHNLGRIETQEATCTEAGLKEWYCTNGCNERQQTENIPATGHNMVEDKKASVAATCTEAGKTVMVCQNALCKETTTTPIKALGHKEQFVRHVTPATCTSKGMDYYFCDVCDTHIAKDLPAFNHLKAGFATVATTDDVTAIVEIAKVEPTCHADGYKKTQCTICNEIWTDTLPKLAHDWSEWTIDDMPRCETEGMRSRYCLRPCCAEGQNPNGIQKLVKETEILPATGHNVLVWNEDGTGLCVYCSATVTAPADEPETPDEPTTDEPEEPTEKPDAPVVTPDDNENEGSKPTTTPSGVVIPATGDNTSNAAFVVLAAAIVGLAVLAISKKARA